MVGFIRNMQLERERAKKAEKENPIYLDRQTSLMWTKNGELAGTLMGWDEAKNWVKNLNYCGYSDWRLPDFLEWKEFLKRGDDNRAAWFESNGFNNVQSYYYWSSTASSLYDGDTVFIFNAYGKKDLIVGGKRAIYYVWAVRGSQTATIPTPATETPNSQFDFSNKKNPFK